MLHVGRLLRPRQPLLELLQLGRQGGRARRERHDLAGEKAFLEFINPTLFFLIEYFCISSLLWGRLHGWLAGRFDFGLHGLWFVHTGFWHKGRKRIAIVKVRRRLLCVPLLPCMVLWSVARIFTRPPFRRLGALKSLCARRG